MSAETRAEIAAAFSQVAGVSCSPYFRQSTKTGDACVVLARMAADESGFGFVGTWQVWLTLPQDRAAAEKWLDAKHDEIAQATRRVWVPTAVTPMEMVLDSGAVNGVVYEGSR